MEKTKAKIEFGDFQTPDSLSNIMVQILQEKKIDPAIIVEPTCGIGGMLLAANSVFKPLKSIGVEINPEYSGSLVEKTKIDERIVIINRDIFDSIDIIESEINSSELCLFIGNPPWVTNSGIAAIDGQNLPQKENLKNFRGIEAMTGKSNFDIAEYILLKLSEKFHNKKCIFAFLCKTIVARNLLKYYWGKNYLYSEASIYPIDSKKYFSAAADACFFIIDFTSKTDLKECKVYSSVENRTLVATHGYYKKKLIVDINSFISHNYLGKSDYIWRNGIKHDCSKVMELDIEGDRLVNGYGEIVDIENDLVFPLLKSSDIAKKQTAIRKKVIVTQRKVGENTLRIKQFYPKTWSYLIGNKNKLNSRKSSVYKNKPLFSIFSIGEYSFKPYKIAISGLYKRIVFQILSPYDNKPIMVDDTCNFISCDTEAEAHLLFGLLTSQEVTTFLNAIIFWDSKRPITTEVLNSVDLYKVAVTLGVEKDYKVLCRNNGFEW